jgi:glutamine synthetase
MHACDYLLACDVDMDPVPGYTYTSWAIGLRRSSIPFRTSERCASHRGRTRPRVLCDVRRST